jgi:hypothetical protein
MEESKQSTTLGEDLPKLMAYVRDTVIPIYQKVGPAGSFALMMIRKDLDFAAKAMAEGDVVAMIAAYKSLKDIEL